MAKIVIATTTFLRSADELRALLSAATVKKAAEHNFPTVVVDCGSPEAFRLNLRSHGAYLFDEEKKGMGNSRRQAMRIAGEMAGQDGVIVWMEPEKHTLVPLIRQFTAPVENGSADMVVPSRANLTSYPPGQMYAELLGNQALSYMIGRPLDFWFGPAAFNQTVLPYFLNYNGERWGDTWDSIHVPRLQVIATGHRVESVTVDYQHPQRQTEEESGDLVMLMKRVSQLQNLIPSLWTVAFELGLTTQQPPR